MKHINLVKKGSCLILSTLLLSSESPTSGKSKMYQGDVYQGDGEIDT